MGSLQPTFAAIPLVHSSEIRLFHRQYHRAVEQELCHGWVMDIVMAMSTIQRHAVGIWEIAVVNRVPQGTGSKIIPAEHLGTIVKILPSNH